MNLWHELEPGTNPPHLIYVIVEIPKGSRNKYEYSKELGVIKLDRVLFSSLYYPGDYGLIPRSYYEDGDPLDVLVMNNEPTTNRTTALPKANSAWSLRRSPSRIEIRAAVPNPISMLNAMRISMNGKDTVAPARPRGPTACPTKIRSTTL